jgi:hypothetical protein
MPQLTEERLKEIPAEMYELSCLGVLYSYGKHVTIQAHPNSGSQFSNYKKTFSIVLLALVDAHCNFIAVDLGAYGKNSDVGILSHYNLRKALEQGTKCIPRKSVVPGTANEAPYVIVADEARDLRLLCEKINTTKKNVKAVRRSGIGNEFTFMPYPSGGTR